jgi:SAM-dependent methyltransferase
MIFTKKRLRMLTRPWIIPGKLYLLLVAKLQHWHVIKLVFKESKLAHKYLDGLKGIEIGGSAHNPFGLDTLNVDIEDRAKFERMQLENTGKVLPVDIVAEGDDLPLDDNSIDFVVSSHSLEHFPDPIKALLEWGRVVRDGGYILLILPHRDRTFDRDRQRTTLAELIDRHEHGTVPPDTHGTGHLSVWITEDIVELFAYLGSRFDIVETRDVDDKVGNGFTVVAKVHKRPPS